MPAKIKDFSMIGLVGALTLAPFVTWQKSLSKLNELEDCGPNAGCIYSNLFGTGGLAQTFDYFAVHNGEQGTESAEWLAGHGLSVQCKSKAEDEMIAMCQTMNRASIENPIAERLSTQVFGASLYLWGASRIIHDWLLIGGYEFWTTIAFNHLSTAFLFACAVSSLMVGWNALELFFVQVGDNCVCFYHFGFLTAAGALATPAALAAHMVAKIEDVQRAYVGGDYLITKKFHLSYRLFLSSRLKATGPALGPLGLGVSQSNVSVPSSMLPESTSDPLDFVAWSCLLWCLVPLWILALPLFVVRGCQIVSGYVLPSFFAWGIWAMGLVLVIVLCLSFFVCPKLLPGMSVGHMFVIGSDEANYDEGEEWEKFKAQVPEAFAACPEVAQPERLDAMMARYNEKLGKTEYLFSEQKIQEARDAFKKGIDAVRG